MAAPQADFGLVKITWITPDHYVTFPELSEMDKTISRLAPIVCRVEVPDGSGTGILIGGNLLLTCNHVISSFDMAVASTACFFRIVEQDPERRRTMVQIDTLALAPELCFITSPAPGDDREIDDHHLDFTIVALKPVPLLKDLQEHCLSILHDQDPVNDKLFIIHYPECLDSKTLLNRDVKVSMGTQTGNTGTVLFHDANTTPGSSGGALIDMKGTLTAMHIRGRATASREMGLVSVGGKGVLTRKIRAAVDSSEQKDKFYTCLKLDPAALSGSPLSTLTNTIDEQEAVIDRKKTEDQLVKTLSKARGWLRQSADVHPESNS